MNKPKKSKSKIKGGRFEDKVRKTIMSGGLPTDPGDLNYKEYCIECKQTDKNGFRISTKILEKLWGSALSVNKIPYLVIGIKRSETEYFVLKCNISLERKER